MRMKTALLFIFPLIYVSAFAQFKNLPGKRDKAMFDNFDSSQGVRTDQPDSLIFPDTLRRFPEIRNHPELAKPVEDTIDPYRMPVAGLGAKFHSNMPVVVPDSSVHYFILQKKIPHRSMALSDDKNEFSGPLFYIAEEKPQFPGGEQALKKYIADHIKYPPAIPEYGIQDTVHVSFIIDTTGKVRNPRIIKGVDPTIDKEAIRLVKSFPAWKPAKQQGRKVNFYYTLPIIFSVRSK